MPIDIPKPFETFGFLDEHAKELIDAHRSAAEAETQEASIRACITVLTPQLFAVNPNTPDGNALRITFPIQIVNREESPLVLRATFEMVSKKRTYSAYLVRLDGRPPDAAITAKPDEATSTVAVITQFMPSPVPEQWKDQIQYPSQNERILEHRVIFTDMKTNRTAAVSDRQPYDVS